MTGPRQRDPGCGAEAGDAFGHELGLRLQNAAASLSEAQRRFDHAYAAYFASATPPVADPSVGEGGAG